MTLGDSRLGESKLGVDLAPTKLPDPSETPRDRAEEVMKSPFPTEPGTHWDKFLNTLTEEFEEEYATILDIENQRYIDTATGAPLEKIGSIAFVDRRQGETDEHLRRRIKLQFPKHTTSATLNEIIDSSTMMLDCDPDKLRLVESFDVEPARFDVFIQEQVLRDARVTVDEYVTLLEEVKAAGVRVIATIGKQFTHRSVYEYNNSINDPERAYASEDGSIDGAPYADVITSRHTPPGGFETDGPLAPSRDGFGEGQYGDGPYGA